MLITTQKLPMSSGIPWGTIIFVAIILSGIGFLTYQAVIAPTTIKKPNPKS